MIDWLSRNISYFIAGMWVFCAAYMLLLVGVRIFAILIIAVGITDYASLGAMLLIDVGLSHYCIYKLRKEIKQIRNERKSR